MKFQLLSQNRKMKESSKAGPYVLYNIGIPAFMSKSGVKTCPNATHCVSGCYARNGSYLFSNVAKKYEERLEIVQSIFFFDVMSADIDAALSKLSPGKQLLIRVNDSGDLFDSHYRRQIIRLANKYTQVQFYAYTKMVKFVRLCNQFKIVPDNLTFIMSYGGKQDHLIDTNKHRHAKVFETIDKIPESYVNASKDDTLAIGDNINVGLVYHHRKNYANTGWKNVK